MFFATYSPGYDILIQLYRIFLTLAIIFSKIMDLFEDSGQKGEVIYD
jgi:hypothetical protein